MKITRGFILALLVGLCASARAQVVSQNIVGYLNAVFYPGNNLLANPFATGDNSLNTIFQGDVPEGTTFTEWNPATQACLPASVFDTSSGWSINYLLGYGQGGLLDAPAAFTNTFVGSVWPGFEANGPFVPPLVTRSGWQLLSCVIPIGDATFYDVVGRDPMNGESVTTLDAASQIPTTTTYDNGVWNNGTPLLEVGQAAFFDLGTGAASLAVPEPATGGLVGVGLLFLAAARRFTRRA